MKKGEKGLKNASFWVINLKFFRTLPQTYSSEITLKTGGKALKMHLLGL